MLMTADLSVIATPWMWSPWSQVITATDGFTWMALGVGVSLIVWNRTVWLFVTLLTVWKRKQYTEYWFVFSVIYLKPFKFRKGYKIYRVAPTVVSHDVFEGAEVRHLCLVPAEDFGSGTEVIREVFSVSLPHHTVPTQVVYFDVKWYVVGWPVTCQMKHTKGGG